MWTLIALQAPVHNDELAKSDAEWGSNRIATMTTYNTYSLCFATFPSCPVSCLSWFVSLCAYGFLGFPRHDCMLRRTTSRNSALYLFVVFQVDWTISMEDRGFLKSIYYNVWPWPIHPLVMVPGMLQHMLICLSHSKRSIEDVWFGLSCWYIC